MLPAAAAQGTRSPRVDVLPVRWTANQHVSFVAAVRAAPPDRPRVTVTSGGTNLPAQVTPVLSSRAAVGLVVDASAAAAPSLQGGGLSGVAGFLLQMPPSVHTSVVADRRPPVVVASSSTGPSEDLEAVSGLRGSGERATSDALTLALRQLPRSPGGQPVIVLYTGAANAGGERAAALGERLRRAHAIFAVVTTNADARYWSEVAAATGGLAVRTEPTSAINAFDRVADELWARYVVTFPRPPAPAAQASVRFVTGGTASVVPVRIPPEQSARSVAASGSPSERRLWSDPWFWGLGVAELLAIIATVVIIMRGRRARDRQPVAQAAGADGSGSPGVAPAGADGTDASASASPGVAPARTAPRPAPQGVRFFDIAQPGDPREIKGAPVGEAADHALDASPAQHHGSEDPGR